MKQEYIVTIQPHPLVDDNETIQVTVTQKSENVIGVANGVNVAEAFDLAHSDYVEQLTYHMMRN